MKPTVFLPTVLMLAGPVLHAKSDATPAPSASPEPASSAVGTADRKKGSLWNLPKEYMKILREAAQDFQLENYDRVLRLLDQLDRIQLDTPLALNLRGAVATSQRDFQKASDYFMRALEVAPDYFPARFNLGEVLFLQQRYPEARRHFETMLQGAEGERRELLIFKIFMTFLMEGDRDSAREWMEKLPFPSDTPAYYFARAAWEFRDGRTAEAADWIASSVRIFGDAMNEIYLESFVDIGWVAKHQSRLNQPSARQ